MNQNTADNTNVDLNNETSVAAERDRLRAQADEMEARLSQLRAENGDAETRPSNAARNSRNAAAIKTAKKFVAWTMGVGVVALVGTYVYGKLASMGVEVPVDAVAG